MDIDFPADAKMLRKFNIARYKGVPPDWKLIEKVVEKSGLKMLARFEYVWLMPRSTLTWHKTGSKKLPPKYWHIFYDFDAVNQKYIKRNRRKKNTSFSTSILRTNKHILDDIQTR